MIRLVDYSDSEEEGEYEKVVESSRAYTNCFPGERTVQAGREAEEKKEGITQQKVIEILKRNTSGDNILARMMKSKAYKNPGIDTQIIKYLNIDQFGSNYAKERLDPDLCKSDYISLAKEQLKAHTRDKISWVSEKALCKTAKRED